MCDEFVMLSHQVVEAGRIVSPVSLFLSTGGAEQLDLGIFFISMDASYRFMTTLADQRIEAARQRIPDEVDGPSVLTEANFDYNMDNIYEKA